MNKKNDYRVWTSKLYLQIKFGSPLKNPKDVQTKILEGTVSRAQLLILLKVYNNSAKPLPSNFELHQLAYNDDAWCKSKMSPWFDRYNTEHQI